MASIKINDEFRFALVDIQDVTLGQILAWVHHDYSLEEVVETWPSVSDERALINRIKEEME